MRKVKCIAFLLTASLLCGTARAQTDYDYERKMQNRQHAELLAYNIGLGVVTTTIGSLIHKPKHAPAWPYIRRSLWQGALGGALQYSGKSLTYEITRTQQYWWGWGSKLVHSAGASICMNASMNKPFGQYWFLDYGPARLNFNIEQGRLRFNPQLNVLFAYDLWRGLSVGHLDWGKSLKLGTVTFMSDRSTLREGLGNYQAVGEAATRSIILSSDYLESTIAHELVHVFQYNEYRILNSYFDPLVGKLQNPFFKGLFRYCYIEVPYSAIVYGTVGHNPEHYYRNFFEFEAEFFATRRYVER